VVTYSWNEALRLFVCNNCGAKRVYENTIKEHTQVCERVQAKLGSLQRPWMSTILSAGKKKEE